jgi:hypothetical protein
VGEAAVNENEAALTIVLFLQVPKAHHSISEILLLVVVCGFFMPCSSGFLPVLSAVDEYGIISVEVPVAQWIEHRPPESGAQVRFLSGTLFFLIYQ